MRSMALWVAAVMVAAGCGGTDGQSGTAGSSGEGGSGGDPSFEASLEHTFEPVTVASGSDDYWCQSWTIGNDEPLYVNKVRQVNDGAWHHSNWFFVPDDMFGEDGTWRCSDREFGSVRASLAGGVIFAQSTQAFEETQAFPERTAVVIPPRSKIIGDVHLFNVAASPVETTLTMSFQTIEPEETDVRLREVSFALRDIDIDAGRRSRWAQTCDLTELVSDSFNVYYVLGHYHQWGNYFSLSFVDDEGDETPIVELDNVGDVLGFTVSPPANSNGAKRLKYECGYNNTTDRNLVWGNSGDEEMCQFLAYIDGDMKIGAFPEGQTPQLMGETEDGVLMYEVPCADAPFGLIAADAN